MKIRSVRPEFFSDSTIARLSPWARLLYVGLWCYVDDEGRGQYLPKAIEGAIFPFDDVDIKALLTELEEYGRIVRYAADGEEYFHIPTFETYQKPNRKYESRLPAPTEQLTLMADAVLEQRARSAHAHAVEGEGEGVVEVEVVGEVEVGGGVEGEVASHSRDPIWDTLVVICGTPEPDQRTVYGKTVKWLKECGATPDEMLVRAARIVTEWGDRKFLTVNSLRKHWTRYDALVGQLSSAQIASEAEQIRRRESNGLLLDKIAQTASGGPQNRLEAP
jgi:hypothetical protein